MKRGCSLEDVLRFICGRPARDLDALLLFTGLEGTGKSTFAVVLFKEIARRLGRPFTVAGHVRFGQSPFLKLLQGLPRASVALLDEGDLNRRSWASRARRVLLNFLQKCRGLNHVMGICFPHVSMMDKAVKQNRVLLRFHAAVRQRDRVKILVFKPGARSMHKAADDVYWDLITWFWFDKPPSDLPILQEYLAAKRAAMRGILPDEAPAKPLVDLEALDL